MKKLIVIGLTILWLMPGCKKQELTIDETTSQTTTNQVGVVSITYSIHVSDATLIGKSSVGLSGAQVTIISTSGGKSSKTTDSDGYVVFPSVKEGVVSGYVSISGYTEVHFSAALIASDPGGIANVVEHANTDIVLWPLTADLNGVVYSDFDLDGFFDVTDPNDKESGIDMTLSLTSSQPSGNFSSGIILDSYIQPSLFTATTNSDGQITFSNLPANDAAGSISSSLNAVPYYKGDYIYTGTFGGVALQPDANNFTGLHLLTQTKYKNF